MGLPVHRAARGILAPSCTCHVQEPSGLRSTPVLSQNSTTHISPWTAPEADTSRNLAQAVAKGMPRWQVKPGVTTGQRVHSVQQENQHSGYGQNRIPGLRERSCQAALAAMTNAMDSRHLLLPFQRWEVQDQGTSRLGSQ